MSERMKYRAWDLGMDLKLLGWMDEGEEEKEEKGLKQKFGRVCQAR